MTKQQVIQQAYGEYWECAKHICDANGWIDSYANLAFKDEFPIKMQSGNLWRPFTLFGLESNNGWSRIDEKGFPNENMIDNQFEVGIMLDNGDFCKRPGNFNIGNVKNLFEYENITHWRVVEVTKPMY